MFVHIWLFVLADILIYIDIAISKGASVFWIDNYAVFYTSSGVAVYVTIFDDLLNVLKF